MNYLSCLFLCLFVYLFVCFLLHQISRLFSLLFIVKERKNKEEKGSISEFVTRGLDRFLCIYLEKQNNPWRIFEIMFVFFL